jgi:ribosome recycling factor
MNNLKIEQQFQIASFKQQVAQMSREDAQNLLVKLYEQMLVQEVTYKQLLKHQWGLTDAIKTE